MPLFPLAIHTRILISMEGGNAGGRATRELLVSTAERLFAEQGLAAVSLRQIGQESGQRNSGATQYHFGTRENLVAAIYARRADPMNRRRLELLEQLDAAGEGKQLDRLLWALLSPHVDSVADADNHFLGFLARVLTEQSRLEIVGQEAGGDVYVHMTAYEQIRSRLHGCLPMLSDAEFERRFSTIFNWAIHALAEHARDRDEADPAVVDDLIAMLAEALSAPPSRAATARKPRRARRTARSS